MNAHQRRVARRKGWKRGDDNKIKMRGFVRMESDTPPEIRMVGQVYTNSVSRKQFVAIGLSLDTVEWVEFSDDHDAIRKMRGALRRER